MNITFFSNQRGRVARIQEATQPLLLRVEGFAPSQNFALTQLGLDGRSLSSLSEGFGDSIFIYVIKEGMGNMQLSGVTFPGDCETSEANRTHGFESILDYYYQSYGLTARGKPIKITVNKKVIEGFVIAFAAGITDADSGIGSFSLVLKTLVPPKPPRQFT